MSNDYAAGFWRELGAVTGEVDPQKREELGQEIGNFFAAWLRGEGRGCADELKSEDDKKFILGFCEDLALFLEGDK